MSCSSGDSLEPRAISATEVVVTHSRSRTISGAMTADEFRRLALNLREVVEGSHMGHADFRVGGKVFATLGYPDERYGAIMLTPQDQDLLVKDHPKTFAPAAGAWGA